LLAPYNSGEASIERLGLPGWVVDLRHDAAHGELPTLPSLRMAAKTLLEFFSTLYWKPHSETRQVAKEQALELLLRCKTLSEEMSMESIAAAHMSITTTQNSQLIRANNFVTLVSMDIGMPLAVAKSPRKRTLSQHTTFPAKKKNFAELIPKEKKPAVSIVQPSSLEEMEAMFLSSDDEEKSASCELSCGHDQKIGKSAEEEEEKISSPWSRCHSWDSCAIGSFPGQPPRRDFYTV